MTPLSPRQQQCAELAARGLSNQQIAARLGLSLGTVKTHIYAVYNKLGIESRFDLWRRFGPKEAA